MFYIAIAVIAGTLAAILAEYLLSHLLPHQPRRKHIIAASIATVIFFAISVWATSNESEFTQRTSSGASPTPTIKSPESPAFNEEGIDQIQSATEEPPVRPAPTTIPIEPSTPIILREDVDSELTALNIPGATVTVLDDSPDLSEPGIGHAIIQLVSPSEVLQHRRSNGYYVHSVVKDIAGNWQVEDLQSNFVQREDGTLEGFLPPGNYGIVFDFYCFDRDDIIAIGFPIYEGMTTEVKAQAGELQVGLIVDGAAEGHETIYLYDDIGHYCALGFTDERGVATFLVSPGTYSVQHVSRVGSQPIGERHEGINVGIGETVQYIIEE